MNNKVNIIYLLGAGRSGTTLLSTVLNSHPKIKTIGEMHQFLEHILLSKNCSCGELLENCEVWKPILTSLNFDKTLIKEYSELSNKEEKHKNILKLILGFGNSNKYLKVQNEVFETIQQNAKGEWLLDSSKYIARYLLLKRSRKLQVRGIYVIRDVRGVINSFSKKVQTPRKPISTIFYYLMINFFGQLVFMFDRKVIKVKYEDFVNNPAIVSAKIYSHIFDENMHKEKPQSNYEMPHIIGGNRMKDKKNITISNDNKWKENIPRAKQLFYAFLAFPMMIVNKYKI